MPRERPTASISSCWVRERKSEEEGGRQGKREGELKKKEGKKRVFDPDLETPPSGPLARARRPPRGRKRKKKTKTQKTHHKHDARRVLLGLLEQVAHPRGADADKHLDELGAGDREEGHAGLAGDRLGEQRLAGPGRADQQHALGDLGAHGREPLGPLEELDHLHNVLLGLVDAGDVVEPDPRVGLHLELGLGLAKGHRVPGAAAADAPGAAAAARQQEEPADEQQREREVAQQARDDGAAVLGLRVRREVDALGAELGEQLLRRARQLHADALDAVAELRARGLDDRDGAVLVEVDLLHAAEVEVLEEARVGHARGGDGVVGGEGRGRGSQGRGRGGGHGEGGEAGHPRALGGVSGLLKGFAFLWRRGGREKKGVA